MDNQESSPALIFPSVPDDFCPTGNWTEVFQQFVDTVLSNGTINVPGLGNVTPAQIQQINDYLLNLQNQIDSITGVNQTQIRQGVVTPLSTGDSIVPVVFTTPMSNNTYSVAFTPRIPANTASALPTFLIQTGSKTISGFSVVVENNGSPAVITELEWLAIGST